MENTYKLAITFNNKPGTIIRIAMVLERRGYTLNSLNINPTGHLSLSEMVVIIKGDESKFEQIVKQIAKLVDIYEVSGKQAEETVLIEAYQATALAS